MNWEESTVSRRGRRAGDELVGPSEVLVQELIHGSGESQPTYCAFFRGGEADRAVEPARMAGGLLHGRRLA